MNVYDRNNSGVAENDPQTLAHGGRAAVSGSRGMRVTPGLNSGCLRRSDARFNEPIRVDRPFSPGWMCAPVGVVAVMFSPPGGLFRSGPGRQNTCFPGDS